MKRKLQIINLVLLGMYSLVLLHNAVPHVHFDDFSVQTEHVDGTHDHGQADHNHHHSPESSGNWINFLIDLFGDTSHQNIESDHFENYIAQNNVRVDAGQLISPVIVVYVLTVINAPEKAVLARTTDPPPLLYQSSFSSSDPQRGPPTVA